MPAKSVVDIEINDEPFQRFYDLFADYSEKLASGPDAWRAIGDAMGDSTKTLSSGAISARDTLALSAAQASVIVSSLKDATAAQHELGRATSVSAKGMHSLSQSAKGVGKFLSEAGGWIVRFGAFAGLGGLLSGFGIGELASSAFTRFRAAGQLGISPGELASFQVNAQQFLTTSALEAAANAKIDISKAGQLSVLGIDWNKARGERSSDLAFDELKAARAAYLDAQKRGVSPMQSPAIMAYLGLGGNIGDVRNAAMLPLTQLLAAQARTRAQTGQLGFDAKTAQAWANLKMTLDRAGTTIQSALINSLSRVTPEIGHLADDVSKFITSFVDSPKFIHLLDEGAHGLEHMLTFLEGVDWTKVGDEVTTFGSDVGSIVKYLGDKLGWVPGLFNKGGALNPGTGKPDRNLWDALWTNDDWADLIWKGAAKFGADFRKQIGGVISGDTQAVKDAWKFMNSPILEPAGASVLSVAKQKGIDPLVALATAQQESGLNPKSKGDYEHGSPTSFGLFQLHRGGELGDLTAEQAYDPTTNAGVALSEFQSVYRLSSQAALNRFSRAIRQSGVKATHDQIMSLAGTPGMFAALAQRPGDPYHYAQGVNQKYAALSKGLFDSIIGTVDSGIKQYGKDWIAHLPKDVAAFVSRAHLSRAESTSTDVSSVNKAILKALSRRTQKPVHVAVTNTTSARVAVSVNAAAQS